VNYSNLNGDGTVHGTLNVNTGASILTRYLNSASTSTTGVINVNGGSLSTQRVHPNGTGSLTINVSGGSMSTYGTISNGGLAAIHTLNLSGGTYTSAGRDFLATTHITGGKLIMAGGAGASILDSDSTWNGGTIVTNSSTGSSGYMLTAEGTQLMNLWSTTDVNVLQLSDKTTKQTLTFQGNATATQGQLHVNIYSSTANDNDVLGAFGTNSLNLNSGVDITLSGVSLAGTTGDYIGKSYKLFNSTLYTGIQATVTSTVLNIGGTDYSVDWINTLSTDGTLTIANLYNIPEPSTYALLLGVGALGYIAFRRRR
jgi:hypothetical protein